MRDVLERFTPGHVISWSLQNRKPGGRTFTYVAFLSDTGFWYTTATDINPFVPMMLDTDELATLLENLGVRTVFLATNWEGEDISP